MLICKINFNSNSNNNFNNNNSNNSHHSSKELDKSLLTLFKHIQVAIILIKFGIIKILKIIYKDLFQQQICKYGVTINILQETYQLLGHKINNLLH